jgi:hypothetical protein
VRKIIVTWDQVVLPVSKRSLPVLSPIIQFQKSFVVKLVFVNYLKNIGMKKLFLPAMIAILSLAAVTTQAQVRVDVHVGLPVRPLALVRPPVVVVRPALRPAVVVERVYRPVIVRPVAVRPVVVARPVVTVVRPVRRVVVY